MSPTRAFLFTREARVGPLEFFKSNSGLAPNSLKLPHTPLPRPTFLPPLAVVAPGDDHHPTWPAAARKNTISSQTNSPDLPHACAIA